MGTWEMLKSGSHQSHSENVSFTWAPAWLWSEWGSKERKKDPVVTTELVLFQRRGFTQSLERRNVTFFLSFIDLLLHTPPLQAKHFLCHLLFNSHNLGGMEYSHSHYSEEEMALGRLSNLSTIMELPVVEPWWQPDDGQRCSLSHTASLWWWLCSVHWALHNPRRCQVIVVVSRRIRH